MVYLISDTAHNRGVSNAHCNECIREQNEQRKVSMSQKIVKGNCTITFILNDLDVWHAEST